MTELRLEKVISLVILIFCIYSCKDRSNTKEEMKVHFVNKDFEQKLYYFIAKSDSLHLKNANNEFILIYLQNVMVDEAPYNKECAIIFYATPPFGCKNYKFGATIKGKKVLFYDDSDCLNFDELITFKSELECSQFFTGEDYEIDSAINLYYKYENGKLLMRDQ